jgi:hypothetical protein
MLRLGSATLATDVTRSVRAFKDAQKFLSFVTGVCGVPRKTGRSHIDCTDDYSRRPSAGFA